MEASQSRAPLPKQLPEYAGLYAVLFQLSVGLCDVILLEVAFLVDNSWLVRR